MGRSCRRQSQTTSPLKREFNPHFSSLVYCAAAIIRPGCVALGRPPRRTVKVRLRRPRPQALPGRPLRRLATTSDEKSGLRKGFWQIVSAGSHPATGRGLYGSRPGFLGRIQKDPHPTLARTSHDLPRANSRGICGELVRQSSISSSHPLQRAKREKSRRGDSQRNALLPSYRCRAGPALVGYGSLLR